MRKTVFRSGIITLIVLVVMGFAMKIMAAPPNQMYYEIKIYRINTTAQADVIDKYLKDAYIPAMHRAGIAKIGVFKPIETDTAYGKLIYVYIPYKNYDQYFGLESVLTADKVYQEAGKDFIDAPYNSPPFVRYESIFMKAFSYMPEFKVYSYTTPPGERIYELRSYGSWTEAKATKKIHMFNEGGEIAIFEKVGSNAVFYGQVLFGSLKPRLMYMTTYADMKSHDEHWKAFGSHPDWLKLKALPEYANTVIKANAFLLHPTSYSDF